ncbi:16150_t:CDS:2, partial [Cetraspora pellucida]
KKDQYAKKRLIERKTSVPNKRRPTQLIQILKYKVEVNYNSIDDGYDNEKKKKFCWLRSRNYINNQPMKTKKTYSLIDDKDLMQYNNNTLLTRAPKRKRGLSIIDLLALYNMANYILTKPASATVRQMLQYPIQHRNLAKALQRPSIKLHQPGEKVEIKNFYDDEDDLFDQLIYKDEKVEETQDVQSFATYLSHAEELQMTPVELKVDDLKEKVEKMCVNKELDAKQQKKAKKLLEREKIFLHKPSMNLNTPITLMI